MMFMKIFHISDCFSFPNEGGPFGGGRRKVGVKVSTCQVLQGRANHSSWAAPRGLGGNCSPPACWLTPRPGGWGSGWESCCPPLLSVGSLRVLCRRLGSGRAEEMKGERKMDLPPAEEALLLRRLNLDCHSGDPGQDGEEVLGGSQVPLRGREEKGRSLGPG